MNANRFVTVFPVGGLVSVLAVYAYLFDSLIATVIFAPLALLFWGYLIGEAALGLAHIAKHARP